VVGVVPAGGPVVDLVAVVSAEAVLVVAVTLVAAAPAEVGEMSDEL